MFIINQIVKKYALFVVSSPNLYNIYLIILVVHLFESSKETGETSKQFFLAAGYTEAADGTYEKIADISASNRTYTSSNDTPSHTPPEQQTQVVAPYTPLPEDHHEERHS